MTNAGHHQPVVSVKHRGRVANVTINNPPVNALSNQVRIELLAAIRALSHDDETDGIVLSGSGQVFCAGADAREMDATPREPSLAELCDTIEQCKKPVAAAINGAALGGGLELALACDIRIATADATIGLPETRLGIIPGAGGTQRLPRLTGIPIAISLIANAQILKTPIARKIGILDEVVAAGVVGAAELTLRHAHKRRVSELEVPPHDDAAADDAARAAMKRAKGVPAIAEAIRLIRIAGTTDFATAMVDERATFLRLKSSAAAKALRHLFFAEREASKVPGLQDIKPRDVGVVTVIGGGTMGSAIAVTLADAGLSTFLLERDAASANTAQKRVRDMYDRYVRAGRLNEREALDCIARISTTPDWSCVAQSALIVEAIFEDLTLKQDLFRRLDQLAHRDTVLATNTSYLDVDAIGAATSRPQDVLGLHFFAPANIMKLVEIVRGQKTSPAALATAIALAKKLGKIGVVARVGEGFIGNRIYSAYRRHCEYLIEDGSSVADVDAAAEAMGFAMGPFAVSDLSGLDIAWATRKRLAPTRDPGERYVNIADQLCELGRLGRKAGKGWYAYPSEAQRGESDPAVGAIIQNERARKGILPRASTAHAIQQRIIAVMANEGAKILSEGIALRPSDIDLVMVNGYGLAPTTGGPMFLADETGLVAILLEVEQAAKVGGAGSEPADLLVELVRRGERFRDFKKPLH